MYSQGDFEITQRRSQLDHLNMLKRIDYTFFQREFLRLFFQADSLEILNKNIDSLLHTPTLVNGIIEFNHLSEMLIQFGFIEASILNTHDFSQKERKLLTKLAGLVRHKIQTELKVNEIDPDGILKAALIKIVNSQVEKRKIGSEGTSLILHVIEKLFENGPIISPKKRVLKKTQYEALLNNLSEKCMRLSIAFAQLKDKGLLLDKLDDTVTQSESRLEKSRDQSTIRKKVEVPEANDESSSYERSQEKSERSLDYSTAEDEKPELEPEQLSSEQLDVKAEDEKPELEPEQLSSEQKDVKVLLDEVKGILKQIVKCIISLTIRPYLEASNLSKCVKDKPDITIFSSIDDIARVYIDLIHQQIKELKFSYKYLTRLYVALNESARKLDIILLGAIRNNQVRDPLTHLTFEILKIIFETESLKRVVKKAAENANFSPIYEAFKEFLAVNGIEKSSYNVSVLQNLMNDSKKDNSAVGSFINKCIAIFSKYFEQTLPLVLKGGFFIGKAMSGIYKICYELKQSFLDNFFNENEFFEYGGDCYFQAENINQQAIRVMRIYKSLNGYVSIIVCGEEREQEVNRAAQQRREEIPKHKCFSYSVNDRETILPISVVMRISEVLNMYGMQINIQNYVNKLQLVPKQDIKKSNPLKKLFIKKVKDDQNSNAFARDVFNVINSVLLAPMNLIAADFGSEETLDTLRNNAAAIKVNTSGARYLSLSLYLVYLERFQREGKYPEALVLLACNRDSKKNSLKTRDKQLTKELDAIDIRFTLELQSQILQLISKRGLMDYNKTSALLLGNAILTGSSRLIIAMLKYLFPKEIDAATLFTLCKTKVSNLYIDGHRAHVLDIVVYYSAMPILALVAEKMEEAYETRKQRLDELMLKLIFGEELHNTTYSSCVSFFNKDKKDTLDLLKRDKRAVKAVGEAKPTLKDPTMFFARFEMGGNIVLEEPSTSISKKFKKLTS